MPPKKLRPSNWRSLEDGEGGTAVVADEAVLVGAAVGDGTVVGFVGVVGVV